MDIFSKDKLSLKTKVLCRSPGFFRKLVTSPSKEVRMLARMIASDPRLTTSKNLSYLKEKTGLEEPESFRSWRVKSELPVQQVPEHEKWRLGLLAKLLGIRQIKYMEVHDSKCITAKTDSICST